MAKLSEVFNIEGIRFKKEDWNKIHIFKVGDFWRAYEWSAWLISVITYNDKVREQTKDRRPLHVTRMARTDTDGTYCFVGFPIKSIEKYIPQRLNYQDIDDKHAIVTIDLPQPTDGSEVTYERLNDAMEKWKDGVAIKENKKKPEKAPKPAPENAGHVPFAGIRAGIIGQIMSYPLGERTPSDNFQFIASLQQQIATIL